MSPLEVKQEALASEAEAPQRVNTAGNGDQAFSLSSALDAIPRFSTHIKHHIANLTTKKKPLVLDILDTFKRRPAPSAHHLFPFHLQRVNVRRLNVLRWGLARGQKLFADCLIWLPLTVSLQFKTHQHQSLKTGSNPAHHSSRVVTQRMECSLSKIV